MGKDMKKEKGVEKTEKTKKDENVVITMRCIDMSSHTSNVDKVPCSECGEITWISTSFRGKKIDKIICENCFFKRERYKDEDCCPCTTEGCLNEAFAALESLGVKTTKEEMIRRMEEKIGKKLKIVKTVKDMKHGI